MSKAMPADFTHLCHPILFLLEEIFKVSPTLEYYNTTIVGRSVKAYTNYQCCHRRLCKNH